MDYMKHYEGWLQSTYFDEATKEELKGIKGNDKEIQERFYKDLEFGTGGLRGILGAGSNRMNIYTVRKATQGLANYISQEGDKAKKQGVAIAYDSRRMSPEFADEAALVLAANGIKAYVFESLRPTPVLSFAVRQLGCIAGIVVTASHNPPEYNGYKVYWEDGAQVTSPKDEDIITEVSKVEDYATVKTMDKEKAMAEGLYQVIGKEIDDLYIAELKKLVIDQEVIKKEADDFTIVYTPLHGTGNIPVRTILKEIGFTKVEVVKEQELPDGNFPTVSYPNPEDIKAFELAIKLGKEKNADVILATDPDADRLGVLAKNAEGAFVPLTGNMVGVLLLDYILSRKQEKGQLPKNGIVVETIVSTNMVGAIAKHFDVAMVETLTGFKYIGEKIKEYEESGEYEYLFGFEESYGCLIGTHARDKDAVVATMGVCELAAFYKSKGITLYEALVALYEKYGYYKESLESLTLKGIEGIEKIEHILTTLRTTPPTELNGVKVVEARDYEHDQIKNLLTGQVRPTGLPKSNVLYFDLEDESWLCIRPSGTEPKVKFYFGVKGSSMEDADAKMESFTKAMMTKIEEIAK
ncbi:MAG: phosphoglucomutase [Firmicutes bacterium HGW-Firmicutes-1]|jgi:phosphoglucomutase|nr:MAG: phosphoglucomutase [Firmicutes bacterium HGW-Firmicutes-1]